MTREEATLILSNMIHDDKAVYGRKDKKRNIALDMAIEALKEQRPHGEWVKDFNMDKAIVCSECGEEAWYKEYCGWVTKSNFCPNCGADMRPKEGEQKCGK